MVNRAAVLGGGAGARAVAADLSIQGCRIRMWDLPRFFDALEQLREQPLLKASGAIEGDAPLDMVTDDIAAACEDAQVIFVVTQAAGHREIAELLRPVISPDQTLVVNPGSTGGALQFARILKDAGAPLPTIAETATLTHTCRVTGPRSVMIRMRVGLVKIAALPAGDTEPLVHMLKPLLPGLSAAANVLETMLCNGNPVIHPAVMLLNAATVERAEGNWEFYEDGIRPSVARVIEAVDRERLALGEAFGLELLPEPEMSRRQGYSEHDDYLRAYRDGPGFQGLGGPATMTHRYLTEDVACGLVTFLQLGELCGLQMPVSRAITQLAAAILQRNFIAEARRGLEVLGLAGMTREQVLRYVQQGPGI